MQTVSADFRKQVKGYGLTTAHILYRRPDHHWLLQSYVWQNYDLFPDFPELQRFLFFVSGEGERHAHFFRVEERDGKRVALAELEVAAELFLAAELGDVHQARDTLLNAGERAVLVKLDDHALHLVALVVPLRGYLPRVFLQCFDREADLSVFDVDYFYLDLVADFKEVARVVHQAPVDFGNVDQALEPLLQFAEGAAVHHAGNLALH